MKIVVVGGKLQGLEAAYLANQAGWEVALVDKDCFVPAQGFCHEFHCLDVIRDVDKLKHIVRSADFIIPALENWSALHSLQGISLAADVPLAFDCQAYEISSSKISSDKLFRENNIPAPAYWPEAKLPLIVKPSGKSGSEGVKKISSSMELAAFCQATDLIENWVVQEHLSGPSYSLEVMGFKGSVISYQVTTLEMDALFDCKRVLAPADLLPDLQEELKIMASKVAGLVNLTGIMDIEVINDNGILKVLEIDARLPSQTPITVWHSTGVNMLEDLHTVFVKGQLPVARSSSVPKQVIFEHIRVGAEKLEVLGEHIMAVTEPLQLISDFWGADQAITNYHYGRSQWVATLIFKGENWAEVSGKRLETMNCLCRYFQISEYR